MELEYRELQDQFAEFKEQMVELVMEKDNTIELQLLKIEKYVQDKFTQEQQESHIQQLLGQIKELQFENKNYKDNFDQQHKLYNDNYKSLLNQHDELSVANQEQDIQNQQLKQQLSQQENQYQSKIKKQNQQLQEITQKYENVTQNLQSKTHEVETLFQTQEKLKDQIEQQQKNLSKSQQLNTNLNSQLQNLQNQHQELQNSHQQQMKNLTTLTQSYEHTLQHLQNLQFQQRDSIQSQQHHFSDTPQKQSLDFGAAIECLEFHQNTKFNMDHHYQSQMKIKKQDFQQDESKQDFLQSENIYFKNNQEFNTPENVLSDQYSNRNSKDEDQSEYSNPQKESLINFDNFHITDFQQSSQINTQQQQTIEDLKKALAQSQQKNFESEALVAQMIRNNSLHVDEVNFWSQKVKSLEEKYETFKKEAGKNLRDKEKQIQMQKLSQINSFIPKFKSTNKRPWD